MIKLGGRNFVISTRTVLSTIVFLAVILRLFSAVYQGNDVSNLPGIYDQISYDGLARRVLDGYGFSFAEGHWPATRAGEPTAHWSYLYTLYLVVVYKVFGGYPLIARVIQALIAGVFQTLLIWRIGSRLFNRTVGLVAAMLNAVYIYFFYYAGALITETFYIAGILWTFDCALRLTQVRPVQIERQTIRWWQWLELGLAIGVTVLLRQVFLIFLPFLFLWIWWNVREVDTNQWKQRLRWPALKGLSLATLTLVLMILPCTIRNQRDFGTFELLNTNAGFAFFWGNHPIYGTRFIPLLPSQQSYYDLIPIELRNLNEAELDKALLQRGLQFIKDDPRRFILLSISRTLEFFKFWPSPNSGLISNISRVGSFGIFLPFMLYGLWSALVSDWKSRTSNERWGIVLLVLFVLSYTAIHLFSWALIRYRLPVDAVLLVFAAFGIQKLVNKSPFIELK
jgi:4-amino-4-deoxy-L-arabinose transferase-like glycosyltransferase